MSFARPFSGTSIARRGCRRSAGAAGAGDGAARACSSRAAAGGVRRRQHPKRRIRRQRKPAPRALRFHLIRPIRRSQRASPRARSKRSSKWRNRPTIFSAGCPACRRKAAPNRWGRCRMSRASSRPAGPWSSWRSDRRRRKAGVRRRPNSPIPTVWRRNCAGNIPAPTSPCSIAASAARTRRK